MKIFYEGKFEKVEEVEADHIHLKNGIVIRNNEIIKFPLGINISTYSQKKSIEKSFYGSRKEQRR